MTAFRSHAHHLINKAVSLFYKLGAKSCGISGLGIEFPNFKHYHVLAGVTPTDLLIEERGRIGRIDRIIPPKVGYDYAQYLTGHGNFKAKMFEFALVDSPDCMACRVPDTVDHVLHEFDKVEDVRMACIRSHRVIDVPKTLKDKDRAMKMIIQGLRHNVGGV
ncbi:hypothetical protein PR048_028223 [Dryococelus australis]|uniref:Uncharacterized protein n=1 Tax=Dryococelus australis TaxID=614101 RepID=A0ABQ9GIN9_9NEOP|nr:hypothetical protein PR048_028223 [Dryococelus australis]